MAIDRTAHVARTAHDKTHLNRLGVPEFGVVEIQVKGQGGSLSKCYRDASSTTPVDPVTTGVDTFHFAPGPQYAAATWTADDTLKDEVRIVYKLHNPHFAIKEAKVQVFTRFSKDPVWERELKDDELLHGEHTLQFDKKDPWDGKIDKHADFPDDYLTAEHSPYKLKLTVSGDGVNTSPTAWTYVHVMVGKLELEYGPKTVLPAQPANLEGGIHSETYDDLIAQGAVPPVGGNVKVILKSDIFTAGGDDMFHNQLYTRYEALWGDGPQIPLFCKVWVKSSADTDVVAYKALGRLKFLWDWESTSVASPTTFTANAENYLVNKTKPKGRNCHDKRGGKRGSKKPVFPKQDGPGSGVVPGALPVGSFPFEVEPLDKPRNWAAYSYAWNGGEAASKTGVIFQPSRMAGDKYKLTVYVDQEYDRKKKYKLNVDADAPLPCPAVLKAETGDYHIWRRVNVRKYVKKNGSVAETINLATVANEYAKAFLELKDLTAGAIANVAEADWNSRLQNYINGLSAARQEMIDPGNQYTKGGGGVYLRDRDEFRDALIAGGELPADVDAYMDDPSNGIHTDAQYLARAKAIGKDIAAAAFGPEAHADSGCTVFHIDKLHNIGSTLLGYACDVPNGNGNRCGFLLCATNADHDAPDNIENTATHEFGHHFFLPHTPDAGEKENYKAHDKSVTTCIMSYNVPTEFCGFCQLRLRGWSKDALKPVPSANKKT
jgi:hypothetical protein